VASLLQRVNQAYAGRTEQRYSIDTWISDYLIPSYGQFAYAGQTYPYGAGPGLNQTLAGNRAAEIANSIPGYRAALQTCPPAFAAQMVRALVVSGARFVFRNPPWHPSTPRRTFGAAGLKVLDPPWPNGTTGQLASRMEWHAGLAGNSYVYRRPDRLQVLRPDWTAVLFGSHVDPEYPTGAIDAELIGYVYWNQGRGAGKPQILDPVDVAHWAPIPDPEMAGLGMSWLTPSIREMQADRLATEHKIRYFEHGATPNLVIKGVPAVSREAFEQLVEDMESRHAGVANAYRTLYLTAGADATVIGSNLRDLDLEGVQDAGETRLSMLSRVPAALLGIRAGLQGSSLNTGNFSAARRLFADTWVFPALQDMSAALASIVNVPADAELWFDGADMPILREDAKDAADIEQVKAQTINAYVKEGFTPESAVAAVRGQDITLLKHTGLLSVQLWIPGTQSPRKPDPAAESPSQPAGGVYNPVPDPAAAKDAAKANGNAPAASGSGN
jgi:hypothetical protein